MSKPFATVSAAARPATFCAPSDAAAGDTGPVVVRDLVLNATIGVYAHERRAAQRIRVNVDLETGHDGPTGAEAADLVRAVVGQGHVTLVETLAERLAERCLADARVRAARIRVEKLDVFPDAASVGVEIERARD
ncbi:dihydroneopterin aldolase [Azospirillum sp. A39]|uniref:dihydroneopterin aldolase n=1 Tax=Azospirillum sp. A39 TaxID=3462279 RepID=UPI004045BA86